MQSGFRYTVPKLSSSRRKIRWLLNDTGIERRRDTPHGAPQQSRGCG